MKTFKKLGRTWYGVRYKETPGANKLLSEFIVLYGYKKFAVLANRVLFAGQEVLYFSEVDTELLGHSIQFILVGNRVCRIKKDQLYEFIEAFKNQLTEVEKLLLL